jgi:hemoglobin-like flavoprotein
MKNLTGKQIVLLRKTVRELHNAGFAAAFYELLFERHPELKPLFPANRGDLEIKLMSVFELVAYSFYEKSQDSFVLQPDVLMPLRELGRKHDNLNILPEHYIIANTTFIRAMRNLPNTTFTEEVFESWKLALQHLTAAMLNPIMKPSSSLMEQTGNTLRQTFEFIKKKLKAS